MQQAGGRAQLSARGCARRQEPLFLHTPNSIGTLFASHLCPGVPLSVCQVKGTRGRLRMGVGAAGLLHAWQVCACILRDRHGPKGMPEPNQLLIV